MVYDSYNPSNGVLSPKDMIAPTFTKQRFRNKNNNAYGLATTTGPSPNAKDVDMNKISIDTEDMPKHVGRKGPSVKGSDKAESDHIFNKKNKLSARGSEPYSPYGGSGKKIPLSPNLHHRESIL